ncbi:hypothetical protein [Loktanella salsilacus]|uniref:hypothetical protein n=1 Tax=Loktanella salsilacus TaxID=195913 RepID=UPI0020B7A0AF|nr:hypothetical protein [Loktanella salsilacus]UTH44886.1 hypothetical protein KBK07_01965 [Loktanella salsilacus]
MTNFKSSLIVAALVSAFGVTGASAADFQPTKSFNDLSAAGVAATEANIAALGVSNRAGNVLTTGELTAIQQIILDQSNEASKAKRVNLIVNGESAGYGPGYSVTY